MIKKNSIGRLRLNLYDKKTHYDQNRYFLKNLFIQSKRVLLISFLFIIAIVGLDILANYIQGFFERSYFLPFRQIALLSTKFNGIFGLRYVEFFKDVIVISAGVLGVILGLFYTSFLNIITTKYSNIHNSISLKMLDQKTITKYFKLLAILVSSSIILQFFLALGYQPTIISAAIFTFLVIVGFSSFIFFGRYSLVFFNLGTLVKDILEEMKSDLNRAYSNRKYYHNRIQPNLVLFKIKKKLETIGLIISESSSPNFKNTALDEISSDLLDFSIKYNGMKHTLPSNLKWFPEVYKYKNWEEASSAELEVFSTTKTGLLPNREADFNRIEKLILKNQFDIFEKISDVDTALYVIQEQYKYLQVISIQFDEELFNEFFKFSEDLTKKKISEHQPTNLKFVSLHANLLVHYYVGLIHNAKKIFNKSNFKELSQKVHHFQNFENVMHLPYAIRVWIDQYQEKLKKEKYYEGKIITPVIYTENAIAWQFILLFQKQVSTFFEKSSKLVFRFNSYLKQKQLQLESLQFLIESLDLYNKGNYLLGLIEDIISKELQENERYSQGKFVVENPEILTEKYLHFKKEVTEEIWKNGFSSLKVRSEENMPDIFGTYYQIISESVISKGVNEEDLDNYPSYLKHFLGINFSYIEQLRGKISDEKNFLKVGSSIYPLVVDQFEVLSFGLIVMKVNNRNDLVNEFYYSLSNFSNGIPLGEERYWTIILSFYNYFKQSFFSLSTSSFVREQFRQREMENYINKKDLLQEISDTGSFGTFRKGYQTSVTDYYFKTLINNYDETFGLRKELTELFIEWFLRTRIGLKSVDIKETSYGKTFTRIVERDNQ